MGQWFLEPNSNISQQDERRQATFLSTLLLFLLFIDISYLIAVLIFWPEQEQNTHLIGGLIMIMVLFSAYLVSRTQWYETAVFVFAIGLGWTIVYNFDQSPINYGLLLFFLIPVIISSMIVSIRKTAVVALIELAYILHVLVAYEASANFWVEGGILIILYLTFVGLTLLSMRHRKNIEQTRRTQISQQETRLQTYFDNASDWLFALDSNGHVTSVNQVVCQELGYTAEEIVGQSPTMFLSEENQPTILGMIQSLFNGEEIPFSEIVVQDKNGRHLWLEVRGRKLLNDNDIVSTFHIARNITDRKIAEDAREKLNREIQLLYETGHRLGQKIDLKTVYNTIHDSIIAVVQFSTFMVSTYHEKDKALIINYLRYEGEEWLSCQSNCIYIEPETDSIEKEIILSGNAKLIKNYPQEIKTHPPLQFLDLSCAEPPHHIIGSALLVPLKIDGAVQGVIQIHSKEINAFSLENLHFLEALSAHIIAAITNANLLQQSQNELVERQRAELEARKRQLLAETLQTSISILNSSLALDEVLTQILGQLSLAIPYDSAAIQQKEGDLLVLRAAQGFVDNDALIGLSFGVEGNLPNSEAMRTQKPLAVDDVRIDYPEFYEIARTYQAESICSWLGVPLIMEGQVIGMITIDRHEKRPFSPDEITLATTFANHAAMALHNAALYRELEQHSEALEQAVIDRTSELQVTTDQVSAILNNSPDAILFLDANKTIQEWNPAVISLFEYEEDEMLGLDFLSLVIKLDHSKFENALETAVFTHTTHRLDLIIQNKNGRLVEVNTALAPLQENGTLTGIVCSLHDVGQFKEVERLKDAFVANVSHELRTPITNLRLHHDLLSLNPKKQDVYIARLGREIDRLNIIVEDLLRISRLDRKQVDLALTEVDIPTLTAQYLTDRKSLAKQKQLTLHLAPNDKMPLVLGDARLLEQVIGILLTNAMNYTPPGGHIHLTPLHKQTNNQSWVGLRIQDSGAGISKEEQTQIFTRFFRGKAAYESGEPGTGLGLAIAQEIMHLHHGQIKLTASSPETGSTFTLWLPTHITKN